MRIKKYPVTVIIKVIIIKKITHVKIIPSTTSLELVVVIIVTKALVWVETVVDTLVEVAIVDV